MKNLSSYSNILKDCHDAYFYALSVENDSAELRFRTLDNKRICLLLCGLERLICNNFREGNIVLSVEIINEEGICTRLLKELFDLNEDDKNKYFFKEFRDKLSKKELSILNISPSFGGEFIALFKDAKVGYLDQ